MGSGGVGAAVVANLWKNPVKGGRDRLSKLAGELWSRSFGKSELFRMEVVENIGNTR